MVLDELEALRWHWDCYRISHPAPDVWLAQRTDDSTMLRAETPGELRDKIVADYMARPIPR
jgi:hypothetical protein